MVRTNIGALRQLYRSLPAAQKLFEMLVQTEPVERITVDELIDELGLGRRNAIDLLRSLEEHGCGDFRVGRKGHPSRLEWCLDPRDLAERIRDHRRVGADGAAGEPPASASEGTESDGEASADRAEQGQLDDEDSERHLDRASQSMINHVFVLRPDLRVVLELPVDLSQREAEVLAEWARNLSFDR